MKVKLGALQLQPEGYKTFIPSSFPPEEDFSVLAETILKANQATPLLGKNWMALRNYCRMWTFSFLYIRKDATSSNQIERNTSGLLWMRLKLRLVFIRIFQKMWTTFCTISML